MPGTSFFTWPRPHVKEFLGDVADEIVFIPFAAVTLSFDAYEDNVARAFEGMGYRLRSVHRVKDKKALVKNAAAIVVGGGNTFALLNRMYEHDLLETIRERIADDVPYIGWSAGANLACPTIKTTNDMPIVMPPSFEALNLVPFQINPHYHELKFENQGGETRKERLEEFISLNPQSTVIGLPEGMFIRREGNVLKVGGDGTAKLYAAGKPIQDLRPGTDVSWML
jgi:dipeptidase E